MLRKQKTFVSMRLHLLRKKTGKKKEEGEKGPSTSKNCMFQTSRLQKAVLLVGC